MSADALPEIVSKSQYKRLSSLEDSLLERAKLAAPGSDEARALIDQAFRLSGPLERFEKQHGIKSK